MLLLRKAHLGEVSVTVWPRGAEGDVRAPRHPRHRVDDRRRTGCGDLGRAPLRLGDTDEAGPKVPPPRALIACCRRRSAGYVRVGCPSGRAAAAATRGADYPLWTAVGPDRKVAA